MDNKSYYKHYNHNRLLIGRLSSENLKMKAASRDRYCTPKEIEIVEIEVPIPKANEILIKVHSSTVNRTDCANLTAKPFIMRFVLGLFKPRKSILGTDFAGEIIEVGKEVKKFKVGDNVFGFIDTGSESHAEYLITTEENTFTIPEGINFKQAAASLEGAHYAYSFIHKVEIKPGQHVLINGATGAIGSALLQFVKQYDVKITATCNTKNIELIRSFGADETIDYTKEDFIVKGGKYDLIFDAVGKSTYGKCKPLLRSRGTYISSEPGPYSQNVFYPILTRFTRKKVVFPIPYKTSKTIPFIIEQLTRGHFKPVVDRTYLLDEISEAYDYVLKGQKTGNVIINI
jgi:NADPH:quinone reductase-like Zn-dependent oxidoreductase